MSNANLSFKLLQKYIDISIRCGYLKAEGYKYVLTEEGLKFLNQCKNLDEQYEKTQKALDLIINKRKLLAQSCEITESLTRIKLKIEART